MMSACCRYFASSPEPGLTRWQWYRADCPSVDRTFVITWYKPLPAVWRAEISEGRESNDVIAQRGDSGRIVPRGYQSHRPLPLTRACGQ